MVGSGLEGAVEVKRPIADVAVLVGWLVGGRGIEDVGDGGEERGGSDDVGRMGRAGGCEW